MAACLLALAYMAKQVFSVGNPETGLIRQDKDRHLMLWDECEGLRRSLRVVSAASLEHSLVEPSSVDFAD